MSGGARLSVSSLTQTQVAAQAGTLLRGQPYLSELAWARASRHGHKTYSLVGMIHTLAPPKVRELIGEVLLAPVQPWDALICTSPAVRQCLEGLLDRWQVHLGQRFGGTRAPRPQLPLLPLGVDQDNLLEQRSDQRSRDFLRRHLRLADHDVLVLWLGRLSFFEKAYPQGMFIALQRAAQRSGRRLHFVMAGWFPGGESDHRRYQRRLGAMPRTCPHFLDGKSGGGALLGGGRSIPFLVDNPQETFGLAPVEAMAVGLPVVVSDWDGYRYSRDGVEGFRVPTLAPTHALQGEDLAYQHDHGLLSYQDYVGAVAQHVAVDTEAAASAIVRLAEDSALRQRMGMAGRLTVQQRFDWPVVARLHHQLYEELAELRRAGQEGSGLEAQHPLRGDPFRDFAPFATACIGSETLLHLAMPLIEIEHRLSNLTFWIAATRISMPVQRMFSDCWFSFQAIVLSLLVQCLAIEKHDGLRLSLTWLAKSVVLIGLTLGLSTS